MKIVQLVIWVISSEIDVNTYRYCTERTQYSYSLIKVSQIDYLNVVFISPERLDVAAAFSTS